MLKVLTIVVRAALRPASTCRSGADAGAQCITMRLAWHHHPGGSCALYRGRLLCSVGDFSQGSALLGRTYRRRFRKTLDTPERAPV
jgi:hypothetical protein